MKRHHLQASPETCHWGFFDATLRPVLTVASGDEVTIDTISGGPDVLPQGCVVKALRDMIALLGEKRNLSREDAYTLCSLAADLRVTQTVNGSKGIHCMIAKAIVHGGM
jgi:acetamidase/formamidase